MLKSGNDLWFFDPSSKASIRLSPQQRLLGQAANGDVVTVNLAKDYQAQLEAEESVLDGDRQSRRWPTTPTRPPCCSPTRRR